MLFIISIINQFLKRLALPLTSQSDYNIYLTCSLLLICCDVGATYQ